MTEPTTTEALALLALWNDVDPTQESAYNDWHAREHVPQRLTVPGVLWAMRFAAAGGGALPRYFTLYGLRDAEVLASEAYLEQLRAPTPTSQRMRAHMRHVSRWVCSVQARRGRIDAAALALTAAAQRPQPGEAEPGEAGWILAERLAGIDSLPWLHQERSRSVNGQWLLCRAFDADAQVPSALTPYRRLPVGPG